MRTRWVAVAAAFLGTLLGATAVHADGAYMQAVLGDAPTVFYPLNEVVPVAFDDSGHLHNAVLNGFIPGSGIAHHVPGPLDPGVNGPNFATQAAGVGVAQLPGAGFLPSGNAPRSEEGWFKADRAPQTQARYPIVAWGGAGAGRAYGLIVLQHAVVLDYFDGTTTFPVAANLFDGRWHYLASTYDGDTAHAYVDGIQVGTAAPIRPRGFVNTQSPSTLLIGDWVDELINSRLQGSVADVAVYPTALDGAQIEAHFNASGVAVVGGGGGTGGGGPSTIALSLPSFSDAFGSPGIVIASAAVAVGGTLFITFPAQIFNLTLQENYATISGWLAPVRRRVAALRNRRRKPEAAERAAPEWITFAVVVAAGALLGGYLDPGFGFNGTSLESWVGIALSLLAGITVAAFVSEVYHRRRHGPARRHLHALPVGLLLGAICVVISRLSSFQPGYLYGVVCGVVFDRTLDRREAGHVAALSTLSVICASVVAWVLFVPLNARAAAQGTFPLLVVIDDFLAALLVGGLVSSVIGLLPLRFLPGGTVREWNPRVWFALFGVAVFALVEFVIRSPAASGAHHSGLVVTLVLFVAFAGVSVGFREYFAARWRREHGVQGRGDLRTWLRELVTPRAAEPEPAVALAGGAGGTTVVTDEPPPGA